MNGKCSRSWHPHLNMLLELLCELLPTLAALRTASQRRVLSTLTRRDSFATDPFAASQLLRSTFLATT